MRIPLWKLWIRAEDLGDLVFATPIRPAPWTHKTMTGAVSKPPRYVVNHIPSRLLNQIPPDEIGTPIGAPPRREGDLSPNSTIPKQTFPTSDHSKHTTPSLYSAPLNKPIWHPGRGMSDWADFNSQISPEQGSWTTTTKTTTNRLPPDAVPPQLPRATWHADAPPGARWAEHEYPPAAPGQDITSWTRQPNPPMSSDWKSTAIYESDLRHNAPHDDRQIKYFPRLPKAGELVWAVVSCPQTRTCKVELAKVYTEAPLWWCKTINRPFCWLPIEDPSTLLKATDPDKIPPVWEHRGNAGFFRNISALGYRRIPKALIQELPLAEVPVDSNDNPYPREDALLYNALSGPSRAYAPSNAPPPRSPLPEQQLGFPGPPPATPPSTYVRATPTTHDSNNAHVSQHDHQTNITLSTRIMQPTETPAPQQDAKNKEHTIQLRTTALSTQPPTSAHSTTHKPPKPLTGTDNPLPSVPEQKSLFYCANHMTLSRVQPKASSGSPENQCGSRAPTGYGSELCPKQSCPTTAPSPHHGKQNRPRTYTTKCL